MFEWPSCRFGTISQLYEQKVVSYGFWKVPEKRNKLKTDISWATFYAVW